MAATLQEQQDLASLLHIYIFCINFFDFGQVNAIRMEILPKWKEIDEKDGIGAGCSSRPTHNRNAARADSPDRV